MSQHKHSEDDVISDYLQIFQIKNWQHWIFDDVEQRPMTIQSEDEALRDDFLYNILFTENSNV